MLQTEKKIKMVQGTFKTKSILASKAAKQEARRGKRIAPKATVLAKQKNLHKRLQASNIQQIEAQLALKAGSQGKLTIMKPLADQQKALMEKKNKQKK